MKIKALIPIVIIGFVVAFTYHFIAIAAIDAPHNESNNVSCGNCHGQGLLQSPFWGGSMSYDQLCQYCHTESSCPGSQYPEITGPLVQTHSDSDDNALAECRTCHNPHYQNLKFYKNTDADELFLAWGKLECLEPEDTNCPYDSGNNTTTLKYTELNYKSESGWDATKLREKTNPCRRTILFPDLKRLGYSYLVESIDEGLQTITVKGDARPVYGYLESWHIDSSSFAVIYGQFIREEINGSQVKYFDKTGKNSFALDDDAVPGPDPTPGVDPAPDGVCQVCHTDEANPDNPTHWRADGTGADHFNNDSNGCIFCHSHVGGFIHGNGSGTECVDCHGTTGSHPAHNVGTIGCDPCHDSAYDVVPGTGYSFTYNDDTNTCSNVRSDTLGSCHFETDVTWDASGCMSCHSSTHDLGNRVNVMTQFNGNSHHIQGTTVEGTHCYQCHWEADGDGLITSYHESDISDSPVDLVLYATSGEDRRPATYSPGTTAIQYTANGMRAEFENLNTHCLSCHRYENNDIKPFGDDKTPKQYAWDNTSIDERYSQTGTTTWGKYTAVANAAKKDITKAYSAHGQATLNAGGWSTSDGVDEVVPDTRNGTKNIVCFDCHNSHGSSVDGVTTSYESTSATHTKGGILKDAEAGKGGYPLLTSNYKPQAGGSTDPEYRNAYNEGAGLCFDCHLTADGGTSKPWGYQGTFGATEPIMGYWDTPYFGPGDFASKQRYSYKTTPHQGGHFGKSSDLDPLNPPSADIGGLCTPCHDPHGVSPSLGGNVQYGVPLLKGTWLTSLYKEDVTPLEKSKATAITYGVPYNIDQNTFGSDIADTVTGITEEDNQFAGLCLNCHQKDSLTDGENHEWKSKDRIHESVKGWKTAPGTVKHNYSCSKCHTPHNSRLPRLMVTNCLDYEHKGYMGYNPNPKIKGWGVFSDYGGSRSDDPDQQGRGRIPGYWEGGRWHGGDHIVQCHEKQNPLYNYCRPGVEQSSCTDQKWNIKTRWADGYVLEITSGPVADDFTVYQSDIRATISWTTNEKSTSYVDYGLTSDYGFTTGKDHDNSNGKKTHTITLTGLENHNTYYYRVRSTAPEPNFLAPGGFDTVVSDEHTFYISLPPWGPSTIPVPPTTCTEPCPITLQWYASSDIDGGPLEYYVEVDDTSDFSSPDYTLDWGSEDDYCVGSTCSWTVTLPLGYWCWRVKVRDGNHPEAESDWSNPHCFNTAPAPSAPILIAEPDIVSPGQVTVTLEWLPSDSPLGNQLDYYVRVFRTSPLFEEYVTSDWISDITSCSGSTCSWSATFDTESTYSWTVQARDSVFQQAISNWSSPSDSFIVKVSNPPPQPTLIPETDIVTTVPVDITLEWNQVTDPDGDPVEYQVWVSEDTYFMSRTESGWLLDTANCVDNICSWTVELSNATTWYWKVQARDANHTSKGSAWSSTDSFRVMLSNPPPAPTLIDEPYIVSTEPVDVELEWNQVEDPDEDPVQYQVEISWASNFWPAFTTSSGWLSEAAASCDGSICKWITNVDPTVYKTWYWRVQAKDSTDTTSPWSDSDSFQILPNTPSNPPSQPTLIPEPDVISIEPVDVTFEWNQVTDPDGDDVEYKVQISQNLGFIPSTSSGWISETTALCDGSKCSWTAEEVANGTIWYWRVQARDANHLELTSPWSDVDSFSTFSSNPPPAPALIDETDVNSDTPVDITLEWNQVADPDGDDVEYNVQVDDFPTFTSPDHESGWISEALASCDGSKCNWIFTVDTGTWYWRVQARDGTPGHEDAVSPWSDIDSFVIYITYPGEPPAPTLFNEPDVVSTVPVDITLEWIPVTCPDDDDAEYYVQLDDDSDFSSLYDELGWISATSWTVTLDPDITWYWRVKARDEVHTDLESVWSGFDSFKIHLPIINESFEKNVVVDGTGYDESWNEIGDLNYLDPDSAIPGVTPPPDAGSECLQSISASTDYQAFARRNYGSELPITFTSMYLYVEDEGLDDGDNKNIGVFEDDANNDVFRFRLNQDAGQLRLNLRIYNIGAYEDYYANISLNTWYRIDIKYDDTNNTWGWKLDGIPQDNGGGNLIGDHYTGIKRWNLGFWSSSQTITGTVYFDLLKVNTVSYY